MSFCKSHGKYYVSLEQVEQFDESDRNEAYQQIDESSNECVNIGRLLEIDQGDDRSKRIIC